jgi:L-seryl-tRNA(Ser) seleniumtransferase
MSIVEHLGIKPFINAIGGFTSYGGAFVSRTVLDAMDEMSHLAVRMDQLQAAAGKIIARITHAESAIVTAGASDSLLLGTAACLSRYDISIMNRLPDTRGIRNEVIVPWHQITGYFHAVRAAGAKVVGVGTAKAFIPAHDQYIVTPEEFEAHISERTLAIAYTFKEDNSPPLEEVIKLGKKYDIPVIIDAAPEVPPVENLHRFIDMGADLVCVSGGKGIRGPQASGILCGRYDLIASAALQMLDIGGTYEAWEPPPSLIPKEKVRSIPGRGIGRSAKVSKEAIVGLVAALEELTNGGFELRRKRFTTILKIVQEHLGNILGIDMEITDNNQRTDPQLMIHVDETVVKKSAASICLELKNGDPVIFMGNTLSQYGKVYVHPGNLSDETARIVGRRLREVLEH